MVIVCLGLILVACYAPVEDIKQYPLDIGIDQTFQAPLNETVTAARQAVSKLGLNRDSDEKIADGCWMLVGSWGSSFTKGAYVRVVVERVSDTETSVRVLMDYYGAGSSQESAHIPKSIFENIGLILEIEVDTDSDQKPTKSEKKILMK